MTADEFNQYQRIIARSRREFCEQLGIARRTGDAYALGRTAIPRTVALAIAALNAGLQPAGTAEHQNSMASGH